MPKSISTTDFNKMSGNQVKENHESGAPVFLPQNGNNSLVVVSGEDYGQILERLAKMKQNGNASLVVISAKDYEQRLKTLAMMKLVSMSEEQPQDRDSDLDAFLDKMDEMIEAHDE